MAILIGHASISERNSINGVKGDQTGGEVCVRTWYNKPWDFMAIHPDANVREKHARAIEAACANNNIGYGQADRNSAYAQAKLVGFDLSKISVKCNCDCSSLQNLAAVASGAKVSYGSNGWVTSNMKYYLKAAGYIIVENKQYLANAEYCIRGAIYVHSGSHTVCGLSDGSYSYTLRHNLGLVPQANKKSVEEIAKEVIRGNWGDGDARESALENAGYNYEEVMAVVNRMLKGSSSTPKPVTPKPTPTQSQVKATKAASHGPSNSKAGQYRVNTSVLRMRNGGDQNKYSIMTNLTKGTIVTCYGYYDVDARGDVWLYVQTTVNGKQYTGFCHSHYLSRI